MAERMVEVVGWKDPIGEGLYNMGVTDERIVRCRDCKHWTFMTIDFGEPFMPIEGHVCVREKNCLAMSANDFCSKGEPKEEQDV